MQYDFDDDFQRNLLAAMLTDSKALALGVQLVKPDYFTDEILAGVCEAAFSFWNQNKRLPDLAAVKEEAKVHVAPGRKWGEYVDVARAVWKRRGTNPDYYRNAAADFARKSAIVEAVTRAPELLSAGDVDGIASLVTRAVQVGRDRSAVYDHFAGVKARLRHYLGRNGEAKVGRVPTGWGPLDEQIQGGLGPGELGLVVARPKGGKSTLLHNLGAEAVMSGRTVLHVTLENSRDVTAARYDIRFFGDAMEEIKRKPKSFLRLMQSLREKYAGKLQIAHFPTKSVTISQIAAHAATLERKPDLVLVDYADLVRPVRKRDDRYIELVEVYEDLRRMAGELAVPIWTASQANRPSVGQKVIGMDGLAGAFEKAAVMDVGISVGDDEEALRRGEMKLFVMGNRLGRDGFEIACEVDWEKMNVRAVADAEEV